MANRQSIPRLLEVGHYRVFFEEFNGRPEEYSKIFNMETSTRNLETDFSIGSMGLWSKRDEGNDLTYDDIPKGFDNTYTHEEFALGYQVTRLMIEDDQYRIVNKFPSLLGESAKETLEIEATSDINNGFDAAYAGGDGKPLFATDHPMPGGGTGSNTLAVAADISETSLEQALIDIHSTVDGRGKQKVLVPKNLIHPLELEWTIKKMLNSDLTAVAGGVTDGTYAQNAINPAKGAITPMMNHYITDSDSWYIQCSKHAMTFFWRRRPEFGRDNDFGTENLRFKGTMRFSHGWSDWMGMYGVPGA